VKKVDFESLMRDVNSSKIISYKTKKRKRFPRLFLRSFNVIGKYLKKLYNKEKFKVLRKRVKHNFFVGFGLGLLVAAFGMFIFKPRPTKTVVTKSMTPAQVIEVAKKYGMKFENEEQQEGQKND